MNANYTEQCPVWHRLFFARRSDAIYCSAKCRKRAQRAKTNKAPDEKGAVYRQTLQGVHALQGLSGQNQLRVLAMAIIEGLPDAQRQKLYAAIENDFYRLKRD